MQPVDLTTLVAFCTWLEQNCVPAKLEQVHQGDRHTLYLGLRTLKQKVWLTISWHPQAARLHLSDRPPSEPDTFTFSQQIWHQVAGLALVKIALVDPWERVVDLQFAKRPGEAAQWHLYAEIMGKYSNLILVNQAGTIVTAAHQVSESQSRVRPIQTGQPYELPPPVLSTKPKADEPFSQWRDRLRLIPQSIKKSLLSNYCGLSSALVHTLLEATQIDRNLNVEMLSDRQWQDLFQVWQFWLDCLEHKRFSPLWLDRKTYTLIGDIYQKLVVSQLDQPGIVGIDREIEHETEIANIDIKDISINVREIPDRLTPTDTPEHELERDYEKINGGAVGNINNYAGVGISIKSNGDGNSIQEIQQELSKLIKSKTATSLLLQPEPELDAFTTSASKPTNLDDADKSGKIEPIAPIKAFTNVNELLQQYYSWHLSQQEFKQLHQQIVQVLQNHLTKLNQKLDSFRDRLNQSAQADLFKQQADLLMANLQQWQPGMSTITLPDFVSHEPVEISLNPEKNAAQNAQLLYKKHQKQKRAKHAILPLMAEVRQEINYLEQVLTAANQTAEAYELGLPGLNQPNRKNGDRAATQSPTNAQAQNQSQNLTKQGQRAIDSKLHAATAIATLREILQELSQQGYLKKSDQLRPDKGKKQSKQSKQSKQKDEPLNCHLYRSPSGFEIWVGRNNFQNDRLTFRIATQYDLWFHTQEIPGSHVLLRLEPGAVASDTDLQAAANLAAYYSKARQSDQVPVVYTEPKHVHKPKGAKPGMAIYTHEQVIWGQPLSVHDYVEIE
jgi:predicted ribosome quality control (RQC) complex YloA/Tae2 family protein